MAEEEKKAELVFNVPGAETLKKLIEHTVTDQHVADALKLMKDEFHYSVEKGLDKGTVSKNREQPGFGELFLEQLQDHTILILLAAALISLVLGLVIEEARAHFEYIDGLVIFFAVGLICCVGAGVEYQKAKQFAELNAEVSNPEVFVLRYDEATKKGVLGKHRLRTVVCGDIIRLKYGDKVPADGFCLMADGIKIDESNLTGEIDLKKKSPDLPAESLLISGSAVKEGSGLMVVSCCGENSYAEKLKSDMNTLKKDQKSEGDDRTPLQKKLDKLADQISWIGLFAGIFTVAALYIMYFISLGKKNKGTTAAPSTTISGESHGGTIAVDLVGFVIIGITIVVVAIPEGLPLAVVLSLAFSVKKMMADKNLVRQLPACETMGSATTICSDKTGTLTENQMKVLGVAIGGKSHDLTQETPDKLKGALTKEISGILLHSLAVNSDPTSSFERTEEKKGEVVQKRLIRKGNPTEVSLLMLVEAMGDNYEQLRSDQHVKKVKTFPFNSKLKRMTTVIENIFGGSKKYVVLTKGAPEVVMDRCGTVVGSDGGATVLLDAKKAEFKNFQHEYATQAYRTLGFAYKYLDSFDEKMEEATVVSDLTFLALVGIADPLRKGVRQAITSCRSAGITVRMVTGDNLETATAIAYKAGILTKQWMQGEYACMIGTDFRNYVEYEPVEELDPKTQKTRTRHTFKQDKFEHIMNNGALRVLARSSPTDKLVLVTGLKKMNEVVAVTGDGTNDALALTQANVGFSMGIAGTEVAKQASDIVITDDNFASIVKAVLWGRNVGDSIRKFLQFQLTVNCCAIVVAFVGALIVRRSPLSTVQLLWINLIMDAFASLALSTEPPEQKMLERPPARPTDPLLDKLMSRNIIMQALYQCIVLLIILFLGAGPSNPDQSEITTIDLGYGPEDWGPAGGFLNIPSGWGPHTRPTQRSVHLTVIFNCFVYMQVFNLPNARRLDNEHDIFRGMTKNKFYIGIQLFITLLQVALIEIPGFNWGVGCTSLITHEHAKGNATVLWLFCLVAGLGSLAVGIIARSLPEGIPFPEFGVALKEEIEEPEPEENRLWLFKMIRRQPTKTFTPTQKFRTGVRAIMAAHQLSGREESLQPQRR